MLTTAQPRSTIIAPRHNNRANLLALPAPARRLHTVTVNRIATRAGGVAWLALALLCAGPAPADAPGPEALAALRAEATRLSMEGAHDAALNTLRRVALLAPADSPQLMADTIFILARADRCADAVTQFETLPPDYEKPLSLLLTVARCYRREREFEQASALYQGLMDRNPENREAVRGMVLTLFDMGLQDEALALLDTVAQSETPPAETLAPAPRPAPPDAPPATAPAPVSIATPIPEAQPEPVAFAEPEPEPEPEPKETPEQKAGLLTAEGVRRQMEDRHAEAEALFRQAIETDPANGAARLGLIRSVARTTGPEAALALCDDALDVRPYDVDVLMEAARLYTTLPDYAAAFGMFDRVLAVSPEHTAALEEKARLYVNVARFSDCEPALEYLEKAMAIRGEAPDLQVEYITTLAACERTADAIRAYEALADDTPRPVALLTAIGRCYREAGRADTAIGLYRGAVSAAPDDPQPTFGLIGVLVEVGDFTGAMNVVQDGLTRFPDLPALLLRKMTLQARSGDRDGALATCERMIELGTLTPQTAGSVAETLLMIESGADLESRCAVRRHVLRCFDGLGAAFPDEAAIQDARVTLVDAVKAEDAAVLAAATPEPVLDAEPETATAPEQAAPEPQPEAAPEEEPEAPPEEEPDATPDTSTMLADRDTPAAEPEPVPEPAALPAPSGMYMTAMRITDLAGLTDTQTATNVADLVNRALALRVNTVMLDPFRYANGYGSATAAYFPNRVLPVHEALLGSVAASLRDAGLAVYVAVPVLGYVLRDTMQQERLAVQRYTGYRVHPAASLQQRLTPFSTEAQERIIMLVEDLAAAVPLDGIVFKEDAFLTDMEDFHPDAQRHCAAALGVPRLDPRTFSEAEYTAWTTLKTQQINALTRALMGAVRSAHPDAVFARVLPAPVLHYPASERWLAQSFPASLALYDYVVIAVAPEREDVVQPRAWIKRLVFAASEHPLGIEKTVFMVHTRDAGRRRPISGRDVARRLTTLAGAGARNIAFGPDGPHAGQPDAEDLEPVMELLAASSSPY
jgi:tetratricopeptide (TPR) repeat protein